MFSSKLVKGAVGHVLRGCILASSFRRIHKEHPPCMYLFLFVYMRLHLSFSCYFFFIILNLLQKLFIILLACVCVCLHSNNTHAYEGNLQYPKMRMQFLDAYTFWLIYVFQANPSKILVVLN